MPKGVPKSGVNKGWFGNRPSWNKGIKYSDEQRKNLSGGPKIGYKQSKEHVEKRKVFYKLHPEVKINAILKFRDKRVGHSVNDNTRKKISNSLKCTFKLHPELNGFYGKHHSEETKQKLRVPNTVEQNRKVKEARKRQILPTKDTAIEIKIQNFLKQLNIEFFTHQYMNIEHGYQCDIFIPSKNLVIECDGDYWHKYPTGRDIDNIRTSELIGKGFKVLRLWEKEIRSMNIHEFKFKMEVINGSSNRPVVYNLAENRAKT